MPSSLASLALSTAQLSATTESPTTRGEVSFSEQAAMVYPKGDHATIIIDLVFFCIMYGGIHALVHVFSKEGNTRYQKLDWAVQGEYRACVISPIHSIISVVFSVCAMFYICGDDKTVFNDTECLATPRYLHIWAVMHTFSYFIIDTINIVFVIRKFTVNDKQMIGHHAIALVTFWATLMLMNFTVVFGVMLLFVELSTTYICIRWLLYTHKQHRTFWNTLNAMTIFLTFLVSRLVFQIWILLWYGLPMLKDFMDETDRTWFDTALAVEMAIATTISAMMNIYWMYLIVCQVIRVATRTVGPTNEYGQSEDISVYSEADGAEPSHDGTSALDEPLLRPRTSSLLQAENDTDEERDDLKLVSN